MAKTVVCMLSVQTFWAGMLLASRTMQGTVFLRSAGGNDLLIGYTVRLLHALQLCSHLHVCFLQHRQHRFCLQPVCESLLLRCQSAWGLGVILKLTMLLVWTTRGFDRQ